MAVRTQWYIHVRNPHRVHHCRWEVVPALFGWVDHDGAGNDCWVGVCRWDVKGNSEVRNRHCEAAREVDRMSTICRCGLSPGTTPDASVRAIDVPIVLLQFADCPRLRRCDSASGPPPHANTLGVGIQQDRRFLAASVLVSSICLSQVMHSQGAAVNAQTRASPSV